VANFLVIVLLLMCTSFALRIALAPSKGVPRRAKALPPDRKKPARGSHPVEPSRPLGPDDNPEFMRELGRRRDTGTTHP
jgi:hypothetical protein